MILAKRFRDPLLAALVTCACGSESTTTPTPIATAAPATQAASAISTRLRVAGRVVDGADNRVVGAKVTRWDSAESAITDASGAFDMILAMQSRDRSFWVTVEKAGYETSELNRSIDTADATSLRIHQIQRIAAGESWQAAINADDSACGYHWGYVCRRVRVTARMPGTLTLDVAPDGAAALGIPIGPVGFPQTMGRHLSIRVEAGSDVAIDVAAESSITAPVGFVLTTALVPGP